MIHSLFIREAINPALDQKKTPRRSDTKIRPKAKGWGNKGRFLSKSIYHKGKAWGTRDITEHLRNWKLQ